MLSSRPADKTGAGGADRGGERVPATHPPTPKSRCMHPVCARMARPDQTTPPATSSSARRRVHQYGVKGPKGPSNWPQKRQKRGECAARASAAAPRVASGAAHGAQVLGAPSQRCGVTRPGQRALPSYRARFAALQRRGKLAPAAVVRARSRAALQRPGRGVSSGRRAGCTRIAASDRSHARSRRCGERRAREVREGPRGGGGFRGHRPGARRVALPCFPGPRST